MTSGEGRSAPVDGGSAVEVLETEPTGELGRHLRGMRDDDERHAVVGAGRAEEIDHLLLVGGIDAGSRLIGEDDPRPVGQGPGHRHALLLAGGELRGAMVESVAEVDRAEELHGPRPVGAPRPEGHRHEDILQGGEPGEEVERLEHHPELVGPHPVAAGLVETGQIDAIDDHPSGIGAGDPGDDVEERRLSRPALPLEGEVLARGDGKGLDVEDVDPATPRHRERLPHLLELDDGGRHGISENRRTGPRGTPRSIPDRHAVGKSGNLAVLGGGDAPVGRERGGTAHELFERLRRAGVYLLARPQRPPILQSSQEAVPTPGAPPSPAPRPRSLPVSIRVGINGFGRIGRLTYRAIYEKFGLDGDVQVVALNDLTDAKTNAHLLEFDSNYGPFKGHVAYEGNDLVVDGRKIKVFAEKDPGAIDWSSQGVQVVVESTGFFTDATKAVAHKRGSVKKVVISAPAKNEDLTIVLGVNNEMYDPSKHHVISNASCTTNGLAPVAKVLHETYGIDRGLLTTVHAYTNSQKTVDTAAKDLRDARAAALNIVPSSTGAARAVGLVIPALQGKFTGMAFRVPTPTVSVVDFTAILNKEASPADINAVMKKAAEGPLKGILRYTDKELVSTDLKGDPHSSIFSAVDTIGLGNFVKVVSWYDNEWGYSNRVADLLNFLEDRGL